MSITAKIFESLVSKQITEFLNINDILVRNQPGFRKFHSATTFLLNSTNRWLLNIDKDLINGVLFLESCRINRTLPNDKIVEWDIPQGFNLGPLLFLLYINDLPKCLSISTLEMFADDTHLTVEGQSYVKVQTKLNDDLERIHRWLVANQLTLSAKKC